MSVEPGRRSLLAMLAAFAALTVAVVLASLAAGALRDPRPAPPSSSSAPSPPPIDAQALPFLGPLATGEPFDGWRIAHVETPRGAIVLELTNDAGERVLAEVRARSASAPPGLAESATLAIYLRSQNRGSETPAIAQRACAALATALSRRENAGVPPPRLEPIGR